MPCVFGPVPSRRLGFSLGLDIVPLKACTLDCVYCQLGRTAVTTMQRHAWVRTGDVMQELQNKLGSCGSIDYITFSGSGEPTLNSELGEMIDAIHALCDYSVAVITNATLMFLPDVRRDVCRADLVVPSLDAVTPHIFQHINRPHPDIKIQSIIEGLVRFRKEFTGQLWIEVMIVPGINDTDQELERIRAVLMDIRPDRIQINSPCRPAAEPGIVPASLPVLEHVRKIFGEHAEIIGDFTGMAQNAPSGDIERAIFDIVMRHPSSPRQISQLLGIPQHEAQQHLTALVSRKRIRTMHHNGCVFYSV